MLLVTSVLLILITYVYTTVLAWPTLRFSPDSWSYFELAKTFGNDPYRFATYRSYFSDTYSASFPFGYPFALFLLHQIFGVHPQVGIFFNLAIAFATPFVAEILVRRLASVTNAGFLCGTLLLLSAPYLEEVVAARAIPMAILINLFAMIFLANGIRKSSYRLILLGGIVSGSAVLVRFDALLPGILLSVFVWFRCRNVISFSAYFLGFFIGLVPWSLFCLYHFGKIFVSDNSWVALAATNAYVTDYPARAMTTIFSDPRSWFFKIAQNFSVFAIYFKTLLLRIMPAALILIATILWLQTWRITLTWNKKNGLVIVLAGALAGLFANVATGYFEPRYFLSLFLWLFMVLLIPSRQFIGNDQRASKRLIIAIGLTLAVHFTVVNFSNYSIWQMHSSSLTQRIRDDDILFQIAACHASEPKTLYIFEDAGLLAAKYGARFGQRTGFLPRNWRDTDTGTHEEFKERFGPLRIINIERLRNNEIDLKSCRLSINPA